MVQLLRRSGPIIFQLCLRYYVGRRSCFVVCVRVCWGGGDFRVGIILGIIVWSIF